MNDTTAAAAASDDSPATTTALPQDTTTTTTTEQQPEFDWPPLESNPDVLTDYLHQIGLSDCYAIGEVYGLDEDLLALVPQPVYAVIVALEKTKEKEEAAAADGTTLLLATDTSNNTNNNTTPLPFYMKQEGSLDNACGIIACLHSIYNQPAAVLETRMIVPDSVLAQFQIATIHQTPHERSRALEQFAQFRTVHRTFAQQGQSAAILHNQNQVHHHYVAFVVWQGQLYELDGTRPEGPRRIESAGTSAFGSESSSSCDVLRGAIAEIQKRLAAGEITERLSILTLNPAVDF